jgi:ABC-type multidrug transport system ATPase subunit
MDTTGVVIEVQHLAVHAPKNAPAVQDLSLSIPARSLVAVVGSSPDSAPALFACLAGVQPPDDGQILIAGSNLYDYRKAFVPAIGYVPARMSLLTGVTPAEALRTAASFRLPRGTSASVRSARVDGLLAGSGLSSVKDSVISSLPALQRSLAQIAVESVAFPALLLVDRPTDGLVPGSEMALIDFLRSLTREGTTVLFAPGSARLAKQADLLLIVDPNGGLAWFGPPGEAGAYFAGLGSRDPEFPPQPELDDILYLLAAPTGGSAASWASAFQASPAYAKYVDQPLHRKNRDLMLEDRPLSRLRSRGNEAQPPVRLPRSTGLQQYFTFLSRNLRLLARDPFGMGFAFLAPILLGIGIMLTASPGLYDPVQGDANQIDLLLGTLVFLTILIATFGRVQDVVRDNPIFPRERQYEAGVIPYALAKLTLIIPIALYQGIVVSIAYFAAVGFAGGLSALGGFLVTLTLVAWVGAVVGLVASSLARSLQSGIALALLLVLPQFVFGSVLVPMNDLGAAGQVISAVTPARFGFEALVAASGYGKDVAQDVCWAMPTAQRQALTPDQKQNCTCMGSNIFSKCNFPGIRRAVTSLLDQPEPVQPTPDPAMNQIPVQPVIRQGETLDQYAAEISQYTLQLERYQGVVSTYINSLQQYIVGAITWEKQQNFAIGQAETRIADEINDYGPIYNVNLGAYWLTLIGISALLAVIFTAIQTRKGRG